VSEEPKGPPVLKRAGAFTGAAGQETEVGPEAAIAAGLRTGGSLEAASPIRLCYLAAANQAAGRLEVVGERARYALHFKKGVLEHASSSDEGDDLSHFLRRKGLVTDRQLADAQVARADHGGDLFAALAGLKIIDPARSFPVLAEHGLAVAAGALATERGFYTWDPAAPAPATAFPLAARWALVCDAVRRFDGLTLRRRLASRMAAAPCRSGGRIALTDLRLTAQEARLAGQFDGARTLGELVQGAGPEADALLRTSLLLLEVELVAFAEPRGAVRQPPAAKLAGGGASGVTPAPPPPPPPAPPPGATPAQPAQAPSGGTTRGTTPPTPSAPPSPSGGATPAPTRPPLASPPAGAAGAAPLRPPAVTPGGGQSPRAPLTSPAGARPAPSATPVPALAQPAAPRTDLASLQAANERLAKADHFAALGVSATASAAQIKASYFSLAKAYHPDSAPADDPPEARKLRVALFARVSEAWAVLGEEASRKKYAEDVATGAAAVDVAAIFEAENTFTRATVLVKTRQYAQALEELSKAIALNKEEPEFHVWRAWTQFLLAPDKRQQHGAAAAEIEAALKKLPRCMPGYLFLGQMARITGDLSLAEKHWKRGLQVNPEDPELTRELKYLRK